MTQATIVDQIEKKFFQAQQRIRDLEEDNHSLRNELKEVRRQLDSMQGL